MNEVLDEYTEGGDICLKIDYQGRGSYHLFRGGTGDYDQIQVISRSKSVQDLVQYVVEKFPGDPHVELSPAAEMVYSLEVSDGTEIRLEIFDEEDEDYC